MGTTEARKVGAKILRWGNSYGIRITKSEAEELGLKPGDEVILEITAMPGDTVDVSGLRPIPMGGLARRHDEEEWA